jgi:hypothetical protein
MWSAAVRAGWSAGCGQQLDGLVGVGVVDEQVVAVGAERADGGEVATAAGQGVGEQAE